MPDDPLEACCIPIAHKRRVGLINDCRTILIMSNSAIGRWGFRRKGGGLGPAGRLLLIPTVAHSRLLYAEDPTCHIILRRVTLLFPETSGRIDWTEYREEDDVLSWTYLFGASHLYGI